MFANVNHTVSRAVIGAIGTVFFAGLSLAGAAAPAKADEVVRAQVVSYADLDLGSPDGRKALEFRIRQAAHDVCDQNSRESWAVAKQAKCFVGAMNATRQQTIAAIDATRKAG